MATTGTESTVVGESILINGNLTGDEDLSILGRIEGTITLSKTLVVTESGVVKAEVSVRNAIISGVVVGNITASDSVHITESGRLLGDIRAPRVIITAGAKVRGQVEMGDMDAPRAMARSTSSPVRASLPARTATSQGRPALPQARSSSAPTPTPMATRSKVEAKPSATPPSQKKLKRKIIVKRR